MILTTEPSSCKTVTGLARLISHQITVDITRLTLLISAETKITHKVANKNKNKLKSAKHFRNNHLQCSTDKS